MAEDGYASLGLVTAPLDAVWAWISDPSEFPTIYPNWTSEVRKITRSDSEEYEGLTPNGVAFKLVPRLDRKRGVADFDVVVDEGGSVTRVCTRIVRVEEDGQFVGWDIIRFASRREGGDDGFLQAFEVGADADLEHAKEVMERDAASSTRAEDLQTEGGFRAPAGGQKEAPRRYPYFPPYDEAFSELLDSRAGRDGGEVHLPTFARRMLERLAEVGLLRTPDEVPLANVRRVKLVKGGREQELWIMFDTRRSVWGYMDIEVIEKPRSDAAILAAMIAWGTEPMDFERILDALAGERASEELLSPGGSIGAFEARRRACMEDLRNIVAEGEGAASEEWGPVIDSFLEYGDQRQGRAFAQLAYVLHLVRYYRPGFDGYSAQEKLDLIRKAHGHVQGFLESLQRLQSLLEYGAPNRNLWPLIKNPQRDVKAAILADVEGLNSVEIGKRMRVPPDPDYFERWRENQTVRKMVDERGRPILEEAFGEVGWRERAEAMKAERAWWRTLSEEDRSEETRLEMLAFDLGIPIEEARRRVERRRSYPQTHHRLGRGLGGRLRRVPGPYTVEGKPTTVLKLL
jgi:hypothetical protein